MNFKAFSGLKCLDDMKYIDEYERKIENEMLRIILISFFAICLIMLLSIINNLISIFDYLFLNVVSILYFILLKSVKNQRERRTELISSLDEEI